MSTPRRRLADTQAAALAADVKPGTIRVWIHRGKLQKHGRDHAGRDLIDLDELQQLKAS
ncbi:hypothetical protein ACIP9H_29415 [Streptomyces sp. NPDC088732]|uniref:hypothetical protein n=1 Tax=Streptomyces sp. NPDC088732 TaxID=3365879 RepID=UPI0038297117